MVIYIKELLLVVDVQKAFINKETKKTFEKIKELVKSKRYSNIIYGKFLNHKNSPFYNKLGYKECIDNASQELVIDPEDNKIISRDKYSLYTRELVDYIISNNIDNIYICGFDTDACIYITALELFENNFNVYVLKDYCFSSEGSKFHKYGIILLEKQIGEKYII